MRFAAHLEQRPECVFLDGHFDDGLEVHLSRAVAHGVDVMIQAPAGSWPRSVERVQTPRTAQTSLCQSNARGPRGRIPGVGPARANVRVAAPVAVREGASVDAPKVPHRHAHRPQIHRAAHYARVPVPHVHATEVREGRGEATEATPPRSSAFPAAMRQIHTPRGRLSWRHSI